MSYRGTAVIIRSVSGAGKSTFANYIKSIDFVRDVRICEADQYFYDDKGNYNFSIDKLGEAHAFCKRKFKEALDDGVDVIVSNTSVRRSDREFYRQEALKQGYRVFSVVLEKLGTTDVHNLPPEALERQKETLKNNIDL